MKDSRAILPTGEGREVGSGFVDDVYALFDGDAVGAPLEWYLLQDDSASAARWSARVSRAMLRRLRLFVEELPEANVIFCGGDELFVSTSRRSAETLVEELPKIFYEENKLNIAFRTAWVPWQEPSDYSVTPQQVATIGFQSEYGPNYGRRGIHHVTAP